MILTKIYLSLDKYMILTNNLPIYYSEVSTIKKGLKIL